VTTVPCLRFNHMSDAEKRAYALADNKLAIAKTTLQGQLSGAILA
jgi:hypothetical protein